MTILVMIEFNRFTFFHGESERGSNRWESKQRSKCVMGNDVLQIKFGFLNRDWSMIG